MERICFSVGCAMTNYAVYDVAVKKYICSLRAFAELNTATEKFSSLVGAMSESHRAAFLKSVFRNSESGEDAFAVLKSAPVQQLQSVFNKLLFSRTSFAQTEIFSRCQCCKIFFLRH
jgi:hypothetical protein